MTMSRLPQFDLAAVEGVTQQFLERGITDFYSAIEHVGRLPYGRNTDRADFRLVLPEQVGTCATKHALLAQLAQEQGHGVVQLVVGIYEMNERNTPGIGAVLARHGLDSVPEAHCYMVYAGERFDFTRVGVTAEQPIETFLLEQEIAPVQIGDCKMDLHRGYLRTWLNGRGLNETLNEQELWTIREACIQALAET